MFVPFLITGQSVPLHRWLWVDDCATQTTFGVVDKLQLQLPSQVVYARSLKKKFIEEKIN